MNKLSIFLLLGLFIISFVSADLEDVTKDFDGGNYGSVAYTAPNIYNFTISDDPVAPREWIQFNLTNVLNKNITINVDVVDSGTLTSKNFSYTCDGGNTWNSFDGSHNTTNVKTIWRNFTTCNTVTISRIYSYGYERMESYITSLSNTDLTVSTIGKSTEDRNIRLLKITDTSTPDTGKKIVYIISRQHPFEVTGYGLENMTNYLLSSEGDIFRERYIWYIVPMANPDGVYNGLTRVDTLGLDLNRQWNLSASVEINTIKTHMNTLNIDMFIDWHATGNYFDEVILGLNSALSSLYGNNYYNFQNIVEQKFNQNSLFSNIQESSSQNFGISRHYVSQSYNPQSSITMEWGVNDEGLTLDQWKSMGTNIVNSIDSSFDYLRPFTQYKFNENSGTTAYDSGSGSNDGTISGATWTTDGVLNTLTAITDYTINTATGLFTIVNTDYVWSELQATWSYVTGEDCATINVNNVSTAFGLFVTGLLGFLGVMGVIVAIVWLFKYLKPIFSKEQGIQSLGGS